MFNKLKDKKVTIYRETVIGIDEIGQEIMGYTPIHPGKLWAYVRQLSGSEIFAAAQTTTKEEILFTINWRSDITTLNLIEYKGHWYNISRVDTFEGYKENLHLYGKRLAFNPDAALIVPYEVPTI